MHIYRTIAGAALGGLLVLVTQAPPLAAQTWAEYRNERYGFSLRYPSDVFVADQTTEAGDGKMFTALEADARLLVGALRNEAKYTPATYQDYIAQQSYGQYRIEYRRTGDGWFVLSGEGNGKIFYEKVIFSCRGQLINSFAMTYPSDQRGKFDPIVERVEDAFRPGEDCAKAGIASVAAAAKPRATAPLRRRVVARPKPAVAARPSREATRSIPRAPRDVGTRSALADRIARQRGRDVIVILRRNGPPYDRKIVRGYVSR